MLEIDGSMGADSHGTARKGERASAQREDAQRRHSGQPIGAHQRKRGARGYDGGKKVSGRKRHLLVDTLGLVLKAVVHPANLPDRQGGKLVLSTVKGQFPRLAKIWADQGYTGSFARWAEDTLKVDFEVVYPWWRQLKRYWPEVYQQLKQGFQVIVKRWIVERTFAWLTFQRRLVKDYEYLPQTSENLIYLAMIRIMLRRIAST